MACVCSTFGRQQYSDPYYNRPIDLCWEFVQVSFDLTGSVRGPGCRVFYHNSSQGIPKFRLS